MKVEPIVSTLELDDSAICAALLHDVVEDTEVTLEQLEKELNELEYIKKTFCRE